MLRNHLGCFLASDPGEGLKESLRERRLQIFQLGMNFIRGGLVFALAVGCALVPACQVRAATGDPLRSEGLIVRSWGGETGLPQNTINSIVQTRDGYLWLGTREGLARFDGVRFTVFGLREGLQSIDVQRLYEDRQGTLWIGTGGGGLSRYVAGRIETLAVPSGLATSDIISALAEDGAGRLWVGTRSGLIQWDRDQFIRDEALAGLSRTAINALMPDRHGGMWIATARQGLFELRNGQLTESRGPPGDEKILAYCLLEDQAGNIWASIGNGKVLCRRSGQWTRYDESHGLPFAYVTSLAEEADGTIWAGSLDNGLYRFEAGRFFAVRKENGLSANDIRSLRPDREGNLWVGTRTAGLNRLSHRKLVSYGAAEGLTNDFTRSVAETADGTLWVCTYGSGLNLGGPGGFKPSPEERQHAFVDSVLATQDGNLWFGAGRGLFHLQDGKLVNSYTNESWVHSGMVTALCDDRQGGLWIGTSESRLVHFQNGEFVEFPHRVARGPVIALAQQADGFLWVGSEAGGLKRVRLGDDSVISITNGLLSQAIRTLHLESDNTLWIGTAGGGLSRFRDGRIASFTTRQGLWSDTISQIVEADNGDFWLGCSHGIFRLAKSELDVLGSRKTTFVHPKVFGVDDGMPAEECSSGFCPAGLKTKAGLICFSTVKGLVFVDPKKQETDKPPPNVLLEELLVNGQRRTVESRTMGRFDNQVDSASTNSQLRGHISIPPGGREVELHYTAISFAAPANVRFRYQLKGLDRDWVESGGRRAANYHHIPAGSYMFRVTACNADGVWSEPSAGLAITVEPYLWETTWFQVLAGLATLGWLAGVVRLMERRRYRRRLALLEMQHAIERERLRISQDMHDDVGSILTQVSQLSDLGQSETGGKLAANVQFERIGSQARAAVQALDEIVWATNPKNDNLPQFAEYVCRFADEFLENSGMRCWQEVPTDLPNLPLRADLRHNVFMAVKEAFNNIVKHSGATEVWLRLGLEDTTVHLGIEDNGRGFLPDQTALRGNGLGNMKMRLEECGGRMELISAPAKRTGIRFIFPLPKAD
ncbi:sensor histidine kinase [Pedosphaera parvula]|uniref:Putative signal transduction histidine kinase n=1 Tax=Pedosphaera parvula (strain Ellin514) TaxID=320771 RepID=B9XA36_PEDPL|nr:sensor histidine kinase [Pedosphaera parvula]EEF63377.1 putative signal transduction histidine kinase [Pedosphaera parvula Ellin514]